MSSVTRLVLLLVSNIIALWVAEQLVHGLVIDHVWPTLIVAGAVLGVLNWILKPIVTLLALPFILLTLGLLMIAINAAMLGITAWIVPGFSVSSIGAALGGAIIISIVNWVVTTILGVRK